MSDTYFNMLWNMYPRLEFIYKPVNRQKHVHNIVSYECLRRNEAQWGTHLAVGVHGVLPESATIFKTKDNIIKLIKESY